MVIELLRERRANYPRAPVKIDGVARTSYLLGKRFSEKSNFPSCKYIAVAVLRECDDLWKRAPVEIGAKRAGVLGFLVQPEC
jgi:hypothetical protein